VREQNAPEGLADAAPSPDPEEQLLEALPECVTALRAPGTLAHWLLWRSGAYSGFTPAILTSFSLRSKSAMKNFQNSSGEALGAGRTACAA
jgi:hypothetical protein